MLKVGSVNGRGTPQGGILSPGLANFVLADLGRGRQAQYIRYADDFIVLTDDVEGELEYCKAFLRERGNILNEAKTIVGESDKGFEFGGFRFVDFRTSPRPKSIERLYLDLEERKRKWTGTEKEMKSLRGRVDG